MDADAVVLSVVESEEHIVAVVDAADEEAGEDAGGVNG